MRRFKLGFERLHFLTLLPRLDTEYFNDLAPTVRPARPPCRFRTPWRIFRRLKFPAKTARRASQHRWHGEDHKKHDATLVMTVPFCCRMLYLSSGGSGLGLLVIMYVAVHLCPCGTGRAVFPVLAPAAVLDLPYNYIMLYWYLCLVFVYTAALL